MKQKKFLSLFLALALVFSLLPSAMAAAPKGAVGVSLPAAQRWTRDSESLKAALEDLGYDAHLASTADGDQSAQIEALLNKGIKVLVVCAEDRAGVAPALDKAAAKGVKVLAYEQIPSNTDSVEAMVGFHSLEAGRQQAKYAVMRLGMDGKMTAAKPAVIDIIGGSSTDRSALRVVEGALEVLAPYIKAGMVVDPGKPESLLTDGWTADAGKARMQALLKAGHKPDALLCGNDDLLLGAMEAMSTVEGLPNCHLVGRDATAAVVTKIAQGPYPVASVFEDSRALAKRAAELADALARGVALPQAAATVPNGKKEVSIYSVQPQVVWTANYRPVLIDSGYYTAAELGVDPNAPVTAGTALSSLLMWDKTRVNDVEKRGQELDILSTGSGSKTIGMDTVLSRGGAAAILATYCKETGFLPEASTPLTFADVGDVRPPFVTSMEFCVAHGIIKGAGSNRLNPTRDITRQEWGIMLARMAEKQAVLRGREPAAAYARAVVDAVTVEPEEVLPLKTSITKTDPNVTWNAAGDKVLVMTWNNQPEYYTDGTKTVPKGETVWVFTDKELTGWYAANAASITDLDLRLEQLIGLPPDAGYTTMTGLWVSPDRLARPAFSSDITSATMTTTLTGHEKFQKWFGENAAYSYGEGSYPWTRLGYTYDWADNGTEYGLTEFIIRPSSEVEVAFSTPTKDYFAQLAGKLRAGGNFTDEMKISYEMDLDASVGVDAGADAVERKGDHPGSPYFSQVDFYNASSTGSLTILPRFKTLQQTSEWSSGPAVSMMLLDYFGKLGSWNETTLAALRSDHSAHPEETCLDQMIEMLNKVGGFQLETTYDYADNLDAVNMAWFRKHIEAGTPVIIGWNDWGAHWQIAIGYDTMGTDYEGDDVLIVADPYDTSDHNQDGYGVYGMERLVYSFTFFDYFPEGHARDKCFIAVKPAA